MTLVADQIFKEPREFQRVGDGRYQFSVPDLNTDFEIQHVRLERNQLHADVTVYCGLAGVQTWNAVLLPPTDINLSNLRDREQLARTLTNHTKTGEQAATWAAVVSELAIRVKQAEDVGAGVVNLRDVSRPSKDTFHRVGRLLLPQKHPALAFGDGDTLKTYIGYYLLLELGKLGIRVGVLDWELTEFDGRDRGERLSGSAPDIIYLPCTRPLIYEADRIARAIHEHKLEYLMLDSAAPACNGRPEDAENASAYFRVLRSFGIGTLTIAHANRSDQSDQKPFGSVFWFNFARAIWYVKRAEATTDGTTEIGFYPRKFNLGAPQRPTAFRFTFTDTATHVSAVDITEVDSLAAKLPLKDRITSLVRHRARTITELATKLDSDSETISRTVRRYSGDTAKVRLFTRLPDDRIGLAERRAS